MNNKLYIYIIPLLALIPIFIFRDYTPDNELRYISIIEEALNNGSFFAFYNHGIAYADKPPLYFWLLMACRQLTGENIMLLLGLFTLIPCAVIFYVMNTMSYGKKIVKTAPVMALATAVMFIGSTVVLRMDMMMVMFIVLALYNFYRMYSGTAGRWTGCFLALNIFAALFSKGPVGVLAPVVSIAVFLLSEHKIKTIGRYLGWRQWAIIVGLCAVWFSCVAAEGGYDYIHNLLFKQTVGRGINSFHHQEPFYYYLRTIWYSAAPWSILCAVVIFKGFRERVIQNDTLLKFYSVVIFSTFIMMSLVSSKIDIYLLPIYPFLIYLTILLLDKIKIDWTVKVSVAIPAFLFILSPIALLFTEQFMPLMPPNMWLINTGVALLSLGGVCSIISIYKNKIEKAILYIAFSLLITIFTISFTVPHFNDIIGFKNMSMAAQRVAEQRNIDSYAFYQFRSGENMDVYLGKQPKMVENMDELKKLNGTILFIRQREINRQDDLRDYLQNIELVEEIGDFKIFVIE